MAKKFDFDAPDCTCEYRHGIVARNMVGHTPPCPVYERWQAEHGQAYKHDERCIDRTTCEGMIAARDHVIHDQSREIADLRAALLPFAQMWHGDQSGSTRIPWEAIKRAAELTGRNGATEPGGEKERGRTLDG